jgi:Carboxypeptidase regulatory-like domain
MGTRSCALWISILLWAFALAGNQGRSVSGVVTDKRGNILPGAVVEIDNTITKKVESYIVQKDGRYLFRDLNPDVDFVLHALYKGHVSKSWTLSKFDGAKQARMDFVIPIE